MIVSALSSLKHDELVEELEWRIGQLPHHRDKRFAFLTDEKRFVMPPGSQMVLTPTLALPVIRYKMLCFFPFHLTSFTKNKSFTLDRVES